MAYVVDFGVFNLLRSLGEFSPLSAKPLTAKVVSAALATLVAYWGNKNWTYSDRPGRAVRSEMILFFTMNGVAMAIAVACLWFSHYILDLTSPVADNISANIIGVGLGTLFRFYSYRRWVFRG